MGPLDDDDDDIVSDNSESSIFLGRQRHVVCAEQFNTSRKKIL